MFDGSEADDKVDHDEFSHNASMIHSLYQDLYLTDLKNDIGDKELDLKAERVQNMMQTDHIKKLQNALVKARRTILTYRKLLGEMQNDKSKGSKMNSTVTYEDELLDGESGGHVSASQLSRQISHTDG